MMVNKWLGRLLGALLCFFFITIIANRTLYFEKGFLERCASSCVYPVVRVSNFIGQSVKGLFAEQPGGEELVTKYQNLSQEREQLVQENIALKAHLHTVKESHDVTDFQKRYQLNNATIAQIIGRTFNADEHFFLVNKGSRNGIEENMVALYKFQIIGKVVEVFTWYSKVMLISDKNCKVSGFANSTNAQGIAQGHNIVNRVFLEFVGKQLEVKPEDLVLSSGQGLVFPEGFCLGKIINCQKQEPFQLIEIEPMIDFNTVPVCSLMKREKVDIST